MKKNWSMRAYREGDEEGILKLWEVSCPDNEYNREEWMRWWRWIYKDNPAGAGWIWLAENNHRIIGHRGMIPVKMKAGTEIVTGFQSIDSLTHPSYRGKGVYLGLNKEVFTAASAQGAHIGYGFPNENAYPTAVKKLGGFDVARRQPLVKILYCENVLKERLRNKLLLKLMAPAINLVSNKILFRAKRPSFVPGLKINQISFFDERVNEFWDEISGQYPIMVVRDKDYLNWRYVTIPDVNYVIHEAQIAGKIQGYLVFRCMQQQRAKFCVIFDIMAHSEKIAQHLISEAFKYCEREKVDVFYCSMVPDKLYHKTLKRNGFISLPFLKRTYIVAYLSSPNISKEFLEDPQNWIVQEGDSDRL